MLHVQRAAAQAKYPFTTLTLKDDKGRIMTIKRDGDVYRTIENGEQDDRALLIHELGTDLYLVQDVSPMRFPQDQMLPSYHMADYLFVKKRDGNLIVKGHCDVFDVEILHGQDIKIKEASKTIYDCEFKTLQSLVYLGKSPSIWTNPTMTYKIVSIE